MTTSCQRRSLGSTMYSSDIYTLVQIVYANDK